VSNLAGMPEQVGGRSPQLYSIDPLSDVRWDALVAKHPKASVFHQRGWLTSLASTYGYKPIVLTSAAAGEPLTDGIPFCAVKSWITGDRLVSLPFADHCEPLLNDCGKPVEFTEWMSGERERHHWKYVELRPISWCPDSNSRFGADRSYWFHTLDLTPSLEQVFRNFHKDSLQRRIRRAEREHLSYRTGRSEELLSDFYRLLLITRRRHQLPPQPLAWFRNLIRNMGENLQIRVARKGGVAVAALLTLRYRTTAIYKYGCSDHRFHSLAAIPFLFWKFIEDSKATGAEQIDFGRSDLDQDGLINFKDHFGTTLQRITYLRYPNVERNSPGRMTAVRRIFSVLPDSLSRLAGDLVYRHLG